MIVILLHNYFTYFCLGKKSNKRRHCLEKYFTAVHSIKITARQLLKFIKLKFNYRLTLKQFLKIRIFFLLLVNVSRYISQGRIHF